MVLQLGTSQLLLHLCVLTVCAHWLLSLHPRSMNSQQICQRSVTGAYAMYFRHFHCLHHFLTIILQTKKSYLGGIFHPTIYNRTASAGKFQGQQEPASELPGIWIIQVTIIPYHLLNTKQSYIYYVVYLLN